MRALPPHVRRIALVVVLGAVMSTLDTTIVNVALARLAADLGSGIDGIQWVVSAYLLALAAVIPVGGWAVRRFGAFHVYLSALVLFTLGSGLCAVAATAHELVAFRVVQGLGGGLIMPTGMTMLVQAADRADLPRVMSAIGTPMVLAPIMGPTLGGFLLEHVGWNAIFAINIPVGVLAGVAAVKLLPRQPRSARADAHLDWPGLLLACSGVLALTLGLSRGAAEGSLLSPVVLWPALGGLVLLASFVAHARRSDRPLLDVHLYAVRSYAAASLLMFCLNGALFGSMILLPLYLQDVRGLDAASTGLLLVPQGIGAALGMNRSAYAESRLGSGRTALVGLLLVTACTAPFVLIDEHTPYAVLCAAIALRGVGVGLTVNPANTAAFSGLQPHQVVDATPQLNVVQRVGGTLGTAVIAVLLQSRLHHAGGSASGAATAFAATYRWVVLITLLAIGPAVHLLRVERRAARVAEPAPLPGAVLA
jgi:EmrB/QacA subfamily drug resistance transporter